jgi:hypothetical protein
VDLAVAGQHLPPRQVDTQPAQVKDRVLGCLGRLRRVTQGHTHARHQLGHAKRLGEIVVCAGLERRDLVALLPARREHDDRHLAPLAQLLGHLQAVDVGQPQIQQHDRRLAAGHLRDALLAVAGLDQLIAVCGHGRAQKVPDRRLIVDYQNNWLLQGYTKGKRQKVKGKMNG